MIDDVPSRSDTAKRMLRSSQLLRIAGIGDCFTADTPVTELEGTIYTNSRACCAQKMLYWQSSGFRSPANLSALEILGCRGKNLLCASSFVTVFFK